jgi:hypothetical protein
LAGAEDGRRTDWLAHARQMEAYAEAQRADPSIGDAMLTEAYKAVLGRPNDPHVQMVLADLAGFSGFYQVAPPADASMGTLDRREGRREVFAVFSADCFSASETCPISKPQVMLRPMH